MRQNPFKPETSLVNEIHDLINDSRFPYHGLRVDESVKHRKGVSLPDSRHWIDGTPSRGHVGGVSTYGLGESPNHRKIHRALEGMSPYVGNYLTLVGGHNYHPGEDDMEHIIPNGKAIKTWRSE